MFRPVIQSVKRGALVEIAVKVVGKMDTALGLEDPVTAGNLLTANPGNSVIVSQTLL